MRPFGQPEEAAGSDGVTDGAGGSVVEDSRPIMRTDARRNLQHVLNAARDVFGEQGYDAPIEEVARRAQVGVGTVYRRFPNKDALVQYIAEQETRQLTDRALQALAGGGEPWSALEDFVRYSAASGTSRLLPELFSAATGQPLGGTPAQQAALAVGGQPVGTTPVGVTAAGVTAAGMPGAGVPGAVVSATERVPQPRGAAEGSASASRLGPTRLPVPGPARELLGVVGHLVERAREAGQLRPDATVADIMLVIATAPPPLTDPERKTVVSGRLLDILLQGLRTAA